MKYDSRKQRQEIQLTLLYFIHFINNKNLKGLITLSFLILAEPLIECSIEYSVLNMSLLQNVIQLFFISCLDTCLQLTKLAHLRQIRISIHFAICLECKKFSHLVFTCMLSLSFLLKTTRVFYDENICYFCLCIIKHMYLLFDRIFL